MASTFCHEDHLRWRAWFQRTWEEFADAGRADGWEGAQCRRCWSDFRALWRGEDVYEWVEEWLHKDDCYVLGMLPE